MKRLEEDRAGAVYPVDQSVRVGAASQHRRLSREAVRRCWARTPQRFSRAQHLALAPVERVGDDTEAMALVQIDRPGPPLHHLHADLFHHKVLSDGNPPLGV